MVLKEEIQAYKARWSAVEEIQMEERLTASPELRWRQLNADYGLAKGLGLLQPDPDEMEVFKRWAIAASRPNMDKGRIQFWVEQFGEALDLPDLWKTISQLL